MVSTKVVDFTNVKEGGQFKKNRVATGDYLAKILKVEDSVSKRDDEFQYLFTIGLVKFSSFKYPYYCKLQENQLWKLRNLLSAAGISTPKGKFKLNPGKAVGKVIGVTMVDDEYEGREQSTIDAVFPASDLSEGTVVPAESDDVADDTDDDDDDAEVELDVEADEEEEAEEAEEADQFDDMDRDQLKRFIRKNQEGASIKRSESDDDLRTRARSLVEPDDEVDEEDEEEEEEEPPPPPKKKAKKKTAAKKTTKKKAAPKASDDDDELEELDIDDEL